MVLRGNQDTSGIYFLHRVIPAAVPIRHLRSRSAKGESQKLMTEANPEGGDSTGGERANDVRGICAGVRVSRTVGQEDSIWIFRQRFLGRCASWNHRHSGIIF